MSVCDMSCPIVMADESGTKVVSCKVGSLFPYPFIYRHCLRKDIVDFATSVAKTNGDMSEKLLKFGQQVSLMYDEALKATQRDVHNSLHPLRLGAAMSFEDDKIEATWQMKALEYGCTLDPVCQLIVIMERSTCSKPLYLVSVDQFGVIHAPFAQARALLTEHKYQDVLCLVQTAQGELAMVKAQELNPQLDGFSGSLLDSIFKVVPASASTTCL